MVFRVVERWSKVVVEQVEEMEVRSLERVQVSERRMPMEEVRRFLVMESCSSGGANEVSVGRGGG